MSLVFSIRDAVYWFPGTKPHWLPFQSIWQWPLMKLAPNTWATKQAQPKCLSFQGHAHVVTRACEGLFNLSWLLACIKVAIKTMWSGFPSAGHCSVFLVCSSWQYGEFFRGQSVSSFAFLVANLSFLFRNEEFVLTGENPGFWSWGGQTENQNFNPGDPNTTFLPCLSPIPYFPCLNPLC